MTFIGYVATVVKSVDGGELRHVSVGVAASEADAVTMVEQYADEMNKYVSVGEALWGIEGIEPFDIQSVLFAGPPVEVSVGFVPDRVPNKLVIKMVQATDEDAAAFASEPDIDPGYVDDCADCEYEPDFCQYCQFLRV